MPHLVAGVDCSTQSTKVVLVDPESGAHRRARARRRTRSRARAARGRPIPRSGGARSASALAAHGARAARSRAISVAGQQHGLVVLDARRPAAATRDALERHALGARRRAPGRAARRARGRGGPASAASRSRRSRPRSGCGSGASSRHLAAQRRARAPAPRLHDRAARRRRASPTAATRPDGLVVAGRRGATTTRVLELIAARPRARCRGVLGPREAAGTVTAEAAAALGLARGRARGVRHGRQHGRRPRARRRARACRSSASAPRARRSRSRRRRPPTRRGVVAGFADATGRYLPLACTLNCTLAVDRIASWLGLDRDAVEAGGEVVVLPFLDGERTPNRPHASGMITGLRHTTTPGQILRAAYEGAAFSLLDALDQLHGSGSGLDADAPVDPRGRRQPRARLAGDDPAPLRPAAAGPRARRAGGARRRRTGRGHAARRGARGRRASLEAPRPGRSSTRSRATTMRSRASGWRANARKPSMAQ